MAYRFIIFLYFILLLFSNQIASRKKMELVSQTTADFECILLQHNAYYDDKMYDICLIVEQNWFQISTKNHQIKRDNMKLYEFNNREIN